MDGTKDKSIEELKTLPEEVLEDLLNYAEYLKRQRERIKAFESKYGSFEALKEKILTGRHTWEEERDLFEWESIFTEIEKVRRIFKAKGED